MRKARLVSPAWLGILFLWPLGLWAADRDPATWPFSPDSPWNTPLSAKAAFAADTDPCTVDVRDPSIITWINAADWSHPIYLAAESDPVVPIYRQGKLKLKLHVPAAARPALPHTPDGDRHLHIIDPTRHYVDELWKARPYRGGWQAEGYTRNDLYGRGVGAGGERAYGGSAIGGQIRAGELQQGIRHALAFAQPRHKQRPGFVWPATAQDGPGGPRYTGHVPIGQLVAIPPGVDLKGLGLSPEALAIAHALQDYGAYNVDSAADFSLNAEPGLEPELVRAREDLPKLRALLGCVSQNPAPGGDGMRRAPLAPPLRPLSAGAGSTKSR
jgi:hypothetical protein